VLLGVRLLSLFVVSFQQGADPASIFQGHKLTLPLPEQARWRSVEIPPPPSRAPSQSQREEILAAYWYAWESLQRAYETGKTSDLLTAWSGKAYEQAVAAIQSMPPKARIKQVDRNHQLFLHFFSDDSTVAMLDDEAFIIEQTVNGQTIKITASAQVVMTLDNGYWRIRYLVMTQE
jgi:hypothetical protein